MPISLSVPTEFAEPPEYAPFRPPLEMDLEIRVATLLYGGGVKPGQADPLTPFRVPAIRGLLRYWWRATRGGHFTDFGKLYEQESKIWGATDRKSSVTIRVLDATPGMPVEPGEPRYALFPAHQTKGEKPKLYRGGRFRLTVSLERKEYAQDVSAALWAWLTFGGLGARTRRGAGALYCDRYAYTWDANNILGDGSPRPWPVLKGGRVVIGSQRLPWNDCWALVVNLLRDFRQDRAGPRGRSKWPEADEIRSIRKRSEARHATRLQGGGFPRARLGLPIVFHFKDRGDPLDNTLSIEPPEGGSPNEGRMASPVILKPWPVSDRDAVPLLAVLNAPPPSNLVLLQDGKDPYPVTLGQRDAVDELVRRAESAWRVKAMTI